jgi:hypothetical protein
MNQGSDSHPDESHVHLPELRRESVLLDGQPLGTGRLQLDLPPARLGPGHTARGHAGDDPQAAGGAQARSARGAELLSQCQQQMGALHHPHH